MKDKILAGFSDFVRTRWEIWIGCSKISTLIRFSTNDKQTLFLSWEKVLWGIYSEFRQEVEIALVELKKMQNENIAAHSRYCQSFARVLYSFYKILNNTVVRNVLWNTTLPIEKFSLIRAKQYYHNNLLNHIKSRPFIALP